MSQFHVRPETGRVFNLITGVLATATIAGAMLITELQPAWAQHAVISRSATSGPDGAENSQMFVMPAVPTRFDALLRPEFARRDIPLFKEHLQLDEEQMYVLEVMMDNYTEQFSAAADKFRQVQKRFKLKFPGMEGDILGGAMLAPDMLGGVNILEGGDGEAGVFTFDFGDMEFTGDGPASISIGVTTDVNVTASAPDSAAAAAPDGAETQPEVVVAFFAEDENGESVLTEEQQKEITERISAQIRERLAEIEAKRAAAEKAKAEAAERAAKGEPDAVIVDEPPATAQEVAKAGRELIAERTRLRAELVGDVELMLSEQQKPNWPAFERTHRRINTMRLGQFHGESVDVIRLFNQQQPAVADDAALAAARLEYELSLDEALKTRNELLPEHEIEMLLALEAMLQTQSASDEKRLELQDRVAAARVAVRDVNENAMRAFEPALADQDRAAFRKAFQTEAYPHIYAMDSTQRSIDKALTFDDLDAETRTAIETLNANYQLELGPLNDRIAEQTRNAQPREHRTMAELMDKIHAAERLAGETGDRKPIEELFDNPVERMMQQRRQLNRSTMDALRALLTEEQVAQLPRRRSPFIQMPGSDGPAPPPPPGATRVIRVERDGSEAPPPPPPPVGE